MALLILDLPRLTTDNCALAMGQVWHDHHVFAEKHHAAGAQGSKSSAHVFHPPRDGIVVFNHDFEAPSALKSCVTQVDSPLLYFHHSDC